MELLTCPQCGSHEFETSDGVRRCAYCGSQFKEKPAGTSSHKPRRKNQTNIQRDIDELLEKCEKYPFNAQRYASLILSMDPYNAEAKKYL